MYEFVKIDGGWQVFWGPRPLSEETNPTPSEGAFMLPFAQIELSDSAELEYAVAA